jgi:hypothetical protein
MRSCISKACQCRLIFLRGSRLQFSIFVIPATINVFVKCLNLLYHLVCRINLFSLTSLKKICFHSKEAAPSRARRHGPCRKFSPPCRIHKIALRWTSRCPHYLSWPTSRIKLVPALQIMDGEIIFTLPHNVEMTKLKVRYTNTNQGGNE